jgi:hypothetical protein
MGVIGVATTAAAAALCVTSPPSIGGRDAKALTSLIVMVSSTLVATNGLRLLSASLVLDVSPSSSTIFSLITWKLFIVNSAGIFDMVSSSLKIC